MVRRSREGKWAVLAALLLLAQPGYAQDRRVKDEPLVNLRDYLERATQQNADEPAPTRPPRAPRPQPEPRPALWLLQDADTKIYLFGTVHMLPTGYRWRSAAVNEAIRQADDLVLEISDREMMEDPATLLEPMLLGKTAPLAWRVSPDRRETLERMLSELGIPAEAMNSMHSWAATLMIMSLSAMQDMAGDEEPVPPGVMPGVEDGLATEFQALNRPISGVETVAEQIGFFSNLSFAQQRTLLEAMIDDYARNAEAPQDRDLLDAWIRGNTDGVIIGDADMPAMLYEALLTRRNRAWTDWLIARLDRPGTTLFAVGAGHLAGPDSVQTMLAARGFTATRVD